MYVNDLKNNMTFQHDNDLFLVLAISRSQAGRGQANIKFKVKNLRTGTTTNLTFASGDKVATPNIDKRFMQYLYEDSNNLVFMDNNTYEQLEIPKAKMTWELKFLSPNLPVQILQYETEILNITLPERVTLKVVAAEQGVKGDSSSSPSKKVTTETGLIVEAPLFINVDDDIVISTIDGKYQQRG